MWIIYPSRYLSSLLFGQSIIFIKSNDRHFSSNLTEKAKYSLGWSNVRTSAPITNQPTNQQSIMMMVHREVTLTVKRCTLFERWIYIYMYIDNR